MLVSSDLATRATLCEFSIIIYVKSDGSDIFLFFQIEDSGF